LVFIRVYVIHTPAVRLTFMARGWGSIDHGVTPEADLMLVAVPSP
jgi:hypothetical protein